MSAEVIELNLPLRNLPLHLRTMMYMEEEMEQLRKIVLKQNKMIEFLEAKIKAHEWEVD